MSAELWLYFISILSSIDTSISVIFIAGLVICAGVSFAMFVEAPSKETMEFIKGKLKTLKIYLYILGVIAFLIPSEKTMYAMLATNAMSKSNIPERVMSIIDAKLTELEHHEQGSK